MNQQPQMPTNPAPMGGQTGQTGQMMQPKKPAVAKWLWITLIIVAVFGGFFVAWYLLMGPGKVTETETTASAITTDETADWLTYTATTDNYTVKYPTTWGYKLNNAVVEFRETGKTNTINGVDTPAVTIAVAANTKSDTLDAVVAKMVGTPVTMKLDTASAMKFANNDVTTVIAISGTKIYTLTASDLNDVTKNAANVKIFNNMIKSFKFTAATSATSTTATSAAANLVYTNAQYGFTLTLPGTWDGYKMKPATIDGTTANYYVNVPSAGAIGDTTADAGFYAPFALSVYTLDQWATAQAAEGPKDTLIIKNATYAFAWSQANGIPPTGWDKSADIATIIASFKLSN